MIIKENWKNPRILCIFVSFNIDEYDLAFIDKNCNDCTMVVIESMNAPSLYTYRLKHNPNIEYRTRRNVGYDVTAWKEYILENYEKVKTFDYLVLANNSCRYDFLIKDAVNDMRNKNASFYGLNRVFIRTDHIQSYFTIAAKEVVQTPGFLNHWLLMREIVDREDAITYHELTYMADMEKAGARLGSLTEFAFIGSGYEADRYNNKMGVLPPFMKKKILYLDANLSNYEKLLDTIPHMI